MDNRPNTIGNQMFDELANVDSARVTNGSQGMMGLMTELEAHVFAFEAHGSGGLRTHRQGKKCAVGVEGVRTQLMPDSQFMHRGDWLAVWPHADRGVALEPKGLLQRLSARKQRNRVFFQKRHGFSQSVDCESVNAMTLDVKAVTEELCKVDDMKTLAERALFARTREGFETPQAAATVIGCGRTTVVAWESGAALQVGKYLLDAARAYRVRPEWLRLESDDDGYPVTASHVAEHRPAYGRKVKVHAYEIRAVDGADGLDPEKDVLVPEVDVQLSAGPGRPVPEFVETRYRMPFQIEWMRRWGAKPEQVRLMRVHGDSMERTLFDGDRVAVHLADTRVIDGKVYAVMAPEPRIKRLFRLRDGSLRIVSDNENKHLFPDEVVPATDLESVYILGRVIDKSGAGGL